MKKEKTDLLYLRIVEEEVGYSLYLDDKKLHHIEKYNIESSTVPGTAELSMKMLVKYP